MGSKQFRKFHENNYNPEWKLKKKQFDLSKFVGKKKGSIKIDVDKLN